MRVEGTIQRWSEAKGYGFIQSAQHSNVFVHIRDFRGPTPPSEGLRVSYEEILVGSKGPRAMDVRPVTAPAAATGPTRAAGTRHPAARPSPDNRRQRRGNAPTPKPAAPNGAGLAILLMVSWLGLLIWGAVSGRLPFWLLGGAAAINALTYLVYAHDKSAARRDAWRTSEGALHMLALLGGWPAAWWAQQNLRHKSRKVEFRRIYWLTLVLNCAALVYVLAHPEWIGMHPA
ncbi:DUF1294 domain-containing protein [Ottowia sp.]|uniref:DUF1294 domain-containing protein n=1 Tax=Ottowia sp. TaxID=1898956 RepID=UPI0039E310BA